VLDVGPDNPSRPIDVIHYDRSVPKSVLILRVHFILRTKDENAVVEVSDLLELPPEVQIPPWIVREAVFRPEDNIPVNSRNWLGLFEEAVIVVRVGLDHVDGDRVTRGRR